MGVIYTILILGALTTIYPFLLMVTTGFTGPTDQNENKLIPAFWSDAQKVEDKFFDDKYAGNASYLAMVKARPEDGKQLAEYEKFLTELDPMQWHAGFRTAPNQVTSKLSLKYQSWLREKFSSIDKLNVAYIEENIAFQTVQPPIEQLDKKGWKPRVGQKWADWLEFKKSLGPEFRIPMLRSRMVQEYIRAKYQNQIGQVPPEIAGPAKTFEELRIDPQSEIFKEFEAKALPDGLKDGGPEARWDAKFGTVMPVRSFDQQFVVAHGSEIKSEFTSRNYRYVLDYMLINGRAIANTALFCCLVILTHLIVNPLAAYALSRYPLPSSGKILIFLLATMAFPAEVAMIPSFLLLKDLHLLNTFAALVLPGAASGYMIFLLKGFFDSLPQELYESGQLDGAKEWTMLRKIALPLSKPVLGYLALLSFMGAYGAFMYAFLVCQDRSMWTIMVFIYQLQNTAPKAVMMAAVTIAAIPTLIVFLLCQRVIMRGIVLPGER